MIITLNDSNFAAETAKAEPILVDFWATWCAPCMMQGKVLEELNQKFPGLRIGKVNVDENRALAMEYRVSAIPTMILFRNDEIAETIVGLRQPQELLELFRRNGADV